MIDPLALPDDLPVPIDDGAAAHLVGMSLPAIALRATDGSLVDFSKLAGRGVIYCYPRTGLPGQALPDGWDDIPGARGCTPQSCSYRDHFSEIQALGATVFGLTTQDTDYQQEMAERLQLPFLVLSDNKLGFAKDLRLPLFEVADMVLLKRLTMIVEDGVILAVHYPVYPSDSDPAWITEKLKEFRLEPITFSSAPAGIF